MRYTYNYAGMLLASMHTFKRDSNLQIHFLNGFTDKIKWFVGGGKKCTLSMDDMEHGCEDKHFTGNVARSNCV